ncbi:S-adenosyl-L-methionine-dependent methyltransferase [Ascobolus immersus RN42]|uniref:S-adenosyl-L-methionine-dependent methyltransferase n=1 Tax=Ascobolus immersus RN42 TaxID=1160509 RepID=A0A3N4I5N1_ASCIM|nr:S-adenosyl-L-methionine-dependent methyltransferase [Ascobolus immersus RN42]
MRSGVPTDWLLIRNLLRAHSFAILCLASISFHFACWDIAKYQLGARSDTESITTSITSSVLNYKYENGRRYHSYREGEYWGPNDEKQLNQLDLAHHLYYLTLSGELYLAPIGNNPQRILDVGTGTGIWAIDMAYRFPSATVIGNDLSPTQPNYVPPNLYFEVDDVEAEWIHRPNSFDFIHVRGLYGCVRDWPKFYDEAYRALRPGGYIEQVEMSVVLESDDNSLPEDGIFKLWGKVSVDAGETFGKTLRICDLMKGYIEDAGFEGVTQRVYKWPIGPWAKGTKMKEIGAWNRMQWEEGIEGWAIMLLTKVLGWSFTEVQAYLGRMRQAMNDPKQHAYHRLKVVYGRKPGGDQDEDFPGY